jgi:MoaA/NifB/PqqE/SkfB family radical SAM enzyme
MDDGAEQAEQSHRTKGLLRLTMACNERCPFCNVPVEDYPRPTPPDAEVDAELAAFVASGERTLTLSGGEPTLLRRRLLRVIAAARARGVPFVELQTNAVLVDADYAGALAEAGLTSAFVSLLSDDAALHDRLAGLAGAWPRCLAGIDALLDAGVRVTLNPVTAADTQDRLPSYVEFVATRLPRVRSISVSVVQPHGRAASDPALLPDYAVLGPAVREARWRAAAHGIELLNPYCGLPACVGWADGLDASVEAVEARAGGWRGTPGVENTGDKRHGPGCRRCVLRARCGGAWHTYWDVRGGSGLVPPAELGGPWVGGPFEGVVRMDGAGIAEAVYAIGERAPGIAEAVHARTEPFVWVWTDRLDAARADAALAAGAGGIAVELDAAALADVAVLRALRRIVRRCEGWPPQRRPALWLGVRAPTGPLASRTGELAAAMGLDAVCLLVDDAARWEALASALAARFGVDVRVVAARR